MIRTIEEDRLDLAAGGKMDVPPPRQLPLLPRKPPQLGIPVPLPPGMPYPFPGAE